MSFKKENEKLLVKLGITKEELESLKPDYDKYFEGLEDKNTTRLYFDLDDEGKYNVILNHLDQMTNPRNTVLKPVRKNPKGYYVAFGQYGIEPIEILYVGSSEKKAKEIVEEMREGYDWVDYEFYRGGK